MKKILLTLTSVLFCAITFAQSVPQGINYQAVARDTLGNEITNQSLNIRFTIQKQIFIGSYLNQYQENHSVTTNDFGLFSVVIGQGISSMGILGNINWSSAHALKVEIDNGNGYIDMGVVPFMSVPFSFKAESAVTADNANPYDEIQNLSISGDTLFISSGNSIVLPSLTQTYSIGDVVHGGIVFWVSDSGKRGLVAARFDQHTLSDWYSAPDYISNPSYYDWFGAEFRDWRLPTKSELNEMYLTLYPQGIGDFYNGYYWSSTEISDVMAYDVLFNLGSATPIQGYKTIPRRVRAVRAFP